jgi:hypothetical protein
MVGKLVAHLRGQWMGALALFLVLSGGTALAITHLAPNSVRSGNIVNNSVLGKDVKESSLKPSCPPNFKLLSGDVCRGPDEGTTNWVDALFKCEAKGYRLPSSAETLAVMQSLSAPPVDTSFWTSDVTGLNTVVSWTITADPPGVLLPNDTASNQSLDTHYRCVASPRG